MACVVLALAFVVERPHPVEKRRATNLVKPKCHRSAAYPGIELWWEALVCAPLGQAGCCRCWSPPAGEESIPRLAVEARRDRVCSHRQSVRSVPDGRVMVGVRHSRYVSRSSAGPSARRSGATCEART